VVMNTDTPNATGMNFSILGMPSTSYLYSIDGVDNPQTGVLGLLLGQNQVQEATVVSTGYSGQFGNAAGGNINFITKSGNNQFHGNAQYYWNGGVLNAKDWFNNALDFPRPFDIANQWAGPSLISLLSAGVPCVVHFLANVGAPSQDALTAGRMDWTAATSDRVFLRFQNDSGHTKRLSPVNSVFDIATQQRWRQIQAVETHTLSATAANKLLFACGRINFSSGVADLAKAVAAVPTHLFFNPPEQLADPGDSFQTRNSLVQYQISEDFVKT